MSLANLPLEFLVLDTETTGFVPKIHRVIELAYIRTGNKIPPQEFSTLLSVPATIPPHIQVLTRIHPEDILQQPTFSSILSQLQSLTNEHTIIVGQNIQFDLKMLKGEGWDLTHLPWIDTAMLASIVFPELHSYSLGYVSEALKLHHEPHHRALGDTRATLELLERCLERLESLSRDQMSRIQELAQRAPEGYRRLFSCITSSEDSSPTWLQDEKKSLQNLSLSSEKSYDANLVVLQDDVLTQGALVYPQNSIVAVRNLETFLQQYSVGKKNNIVLAAEQMLDPHQAEIFLQKQTFTSDEFTLAVKLFLYNVHTKYDLPLHGEEHAIWDGCLRATQSHPLYRAQFTQKNFFIDQRELLRVLRTEPTLLTEGTMVYIDDAAALEDAATYALETKCALAHLRAATTGHTSLLPFVDAIELWIQRLRGTSDVRILAPSDFLQPATINLLTTVRDAFQDVPSNIQRLIQNFLTILESQTLSHSIVWVDANQEGSVTLHAVPRDIATLLQDLLYKKFPTTLVTPASDIVSLRAFLPQNFPVQHTQSSSQAANTHTEILPTTTLDEIITTTKGSTIILASSKRVIEDLYIRLSESCEKQGIALLCQGFGGGQSRIQAEFALASEPKVLVTTHWNYENYLLPKDSVDRLILQSLPFDHPSHPVISERVKHYQDPFEQYSLPRMLLKVFRLLKTFLRHAKTTSNIVLLDARITTKPYGKVFINFLEKILPKTIDSFPVQQQLL